jgi:hypothetical protein
MVQNTVPTGEGPRSLSAPSGDQEIETSVRSELVQRIVHLPHYEGVKALHSEVIALPDGGCVPKVLDRIAHDNPIRAAIIFCDIVGLSILPIEKGGGWESNKQIARKVAAILNRCESVDRIREEIMKLPLVDASTVRESVLGLKAIEAYGPTKAAEELIVRPSDVQRYHAAKRGEGAFYDPSKLDSQRFELAETLFRPMTDKPNLSARNEAILSEYVTTIAPEMFPIERYGYGAIHDTLETEAQRKGLIAIKIPWNALPDAPSHHSHQCADAASTTRSFFASKGIPSDVYVMSVAGINHNVAIAFFKEGDRFLPVVVDVSPFGGAYSIGERGFLASSESRPESRVDFKNPLGTRDVFGQRGESAPAVLGDFPWDGLPTGLAPWFGCELPSGDARMVGFGGVVAFQDGPAWLRERGTPEFYGNGVRDPYVGFQLIIMTQPRDVEAQRIFKCMLGDRRGERVLDDVSNDLPRALLAESLAEAEKRMPDLKVFIKRAGFSLEKRVFTG